MVEQQKQALEQILWQIANDLRGSMDATEFKNYILGFIFYYFLSENIENEIKKRKYDIFMEKWKISEEIIKSNITTVLWYYLKKEDRFEDIIEKAKKIVNNGEDIDIISDFARIFKEIENSAQWTQAEDTFLNLFADINLDSNKLWKIPQDRNEKIAKIILALNKIDFRFEDTEIDVLWDAYEYLIWKFASEAGKKAGEFYTPQEVSKILAKIVTNDWEKKKWLTVYDPTCGSGSLLLRAVKWLWWVGNIKWIYWQELNTTTYNLARMNMILHWVPYDKFNIKNADTLLKPQHLWQKFNCIVANPPFSIKNWGAEKVKDDERFREYGTTAPNWKADYAFIQHMLYHLDNDGTMAVVLPLWVLFRWGAEWKIRQYIIENKNYLDAVINLPADIFYWTTIPTAIMVFKKCRKNNDVLFINAENEYIRWKNQNRLTEENINKIIDTYINRKEIDKFSRKVDITEIKENDYNLNINRYIDNREEEEEIDINAVAEEIKELREKEKQIDKNIKQYCDELWIDTPF